MPPLSLPFIEEARAFLAGRVRRTPVEESPALYEVLGSPARLKLESLQAIGSFKIRGALSSPRVRARAGADIVLK